MKLSPILWSQIDKIYQAIVAHPFNHQLMKGTLAKKRFAYYLAQDSFYLHEFARCLALLAAKMPIGYMRSFLKYAENTFVAEQEIVHQFFTKKFGFKEEKRLTPATLSYTNHLLRSCTLESYEVALAAVLPCFWIYREVGLLIAQGSKKNNPYQQWINAYTDAHFCQSVENAIDILDKVAANTTLVTQQKIQEVFYKSSVLEWHFWNDAYAQRVFDNFSHFN